METSGRAVVLFLLMMIPFRTIVNHPQSVLPSNYK